MRRICTTCLADADPDDAICSHCKAIVVPTSTPRGRELLHQRVLAVREGVMPETGLPARACERCARVDVPQLVEHSTAAQMGAWSLVLFGVASLYLFVYLAVWPIIIGFVLIAKQRAGVLRCPGCRVTPAAPMTHRILLWSGMTIVVTAAFVGLAARNIEHRRSRADLQDRNVRARPPTAGPADRAAFVEDLNRRAGPTSPGYAVEGPSNEILVVIWPECASNCRTMLYESGFIPRVMREQGFKVVRCVCPKQDDGGPLPEDHPVRHGGHRRNIPSNDWGRNRHA